MPTLRAVPTDPSPSNSTWKALAFGLLLFAAVDVGVFRSGLYGWVAKPESSGGWFARRTRFDAVARADLAAPAVLLLGDSRMGEGCSAARLDELLGTGRAKVRDASVPGSPLRVWTALGAQLGIPKRAIVVAGLARYDDFGELEDLAQRTQDLGFLGPDLGLADARELAATFTAPTARRDVWLSLLCKTYAWRLDVQDLFAAPVQRYREVRRQFGRMSWGSSYEGNPGSLAGLRIEGDRLVGLPEGAGETAVHVRQLVWPEGRVDNFAYRERWLGRLAALVAAAEADLVLVRMPTQVLPCARPSPPRERALDGVRALPHVHVVDGGWFAELERPEFFFDGLHLNRAGRERFTALLAAALRAEFPDRWGK